MSKRFERLMRGLRQAEQHLHNELGLPMHNPYLIGISGGKRAGKTSIGNHLWEEHGYTLLNFADPIKNACFEVFGFSAEQLHGDAKEEVDPFWGFTPRHAMQQVGTELFREHFGEDIWVRAVERGLRRRAGDGLSPRVAICDVRFPNEAQAIMRWGGTLIRVERPGLPHSDDHVSETALKGYNGYDHVLVNSGTFADLYEKVDRIMNDVLSFEPTEDNA